MCGIASWQDLQGVLDARLPSAHQSLSPVTAGVETQALPLRRHSCGATTDCTALHRQQRGTDDLLGQGMVQQCLTNVELDEACLLYSFAPVILFNPS